MSADKIASGIEGWLARHRIPAGPDALINRKTILGWLLEIWGALTGWELFEPGRERFGFLRDSWILWTIVTLIWLFPSLRLPCHRDPHSGLFPYRDDGCFLVHEIDSYLKEVLINC